MTQANKIRLLITDVDGVMTDGRIVVGHSGETKSFSVRDGLAIKLWQKAGGEFAILSGRESQPVRDRAAELGIKFVKVGRIDKQTAFEEIEAETGIGRDAIAYIGDDLPDLAPLQMAALGFCPLDATDEVRAQADVVAPCDGGRGVVRFAIETLLKSQGKWSEMVRYFEVKRA